MALDPLLAVGFVFAYTTLSVSLYVLAYRYCPGKRGNQLAELARKFSPGSKTSRVLFVITTLADLVRYFGPTAINFGKNSDFDVHVLVIGPRTTAKRPDRNRGVLITDAMSISASNVTFAWNEHFREKFSMGQAEALAELCLSHILQRGIDVVVTYDSEGVSDSALQPLLHASFILLQKRKRLSGRVAFYALGGVCTLRSIIGLYDIPFAYVFGFSVIAVPADLLKLHRLFYVSTDLPQLTCYFILLFNSYFLCNSLSRIDSRCYFEDLCI